MKFRLTYAVNDDEIVVVELEVEATENYIVAFTEKALEYIKENHGEQSVDSIVGISLLKL